MTANDTSLKDVLSEVAGEAKAQHQNQTDTKSEGLSETKGETKSGETPEYVAGIDISDIPEQDRPRIKDKLEKKAKLLEKGYQDKFKEVAVFKKAQEEILAQGVSIEEARNAIMEKANAKRGITVEKKEVKNTLDTLIDQSPVEQRESLKQLRTILMEETEVAVLRKEIDELKKVLGNVSVGYQDVKKKEIISQLPELEKRYGKDLVSKYRDVIVEESLKFGVSPNQVLRNRADDDEIEQAILSKSKRKEEKLNAVSTEGSGVTSSETIDVSKHKKFGSLLREVIKTGK